jgi:hypothetical protein
MSDFMIPAKLEMLSQVILNTDKKIEKMIRTIKSLEEEINKLHAMLNTKNDNNRAN